jgi:PAS domain S-box-containing protein
MGQLHFNFAESVATWSVRTKLRVSVVWDRLMPPLRSVRRTVVELGYRLKKGHWRLQETLREKEHHLAQLLADSAEPTIVTDDSHRVLAANPAALALFGVSMANIRKFTIDAFLPYSQVHCFERTGPPFVRGTEKLGECVIRRLDGRSKVVEYTFQANFVLGRHLSRFRDSSFQDQMKS